MVSYLFTSCSSNMSGPLMFRIFTSVLFAAQFRRIGWKMMMLGDETWLKLFPNMFDRHDGVSSFFVSFYMEYLEISTRRVT